MRKNKINMFILHGESNSGKTMVLKSAYMGVEGMLFRGNRQYHNDLLCSLVFHHYFLMFPITLFYNVLCLFHHNDEKLIWRKYFIPCLRPVEQKALP